MLIFCVFQLRLLILVNPVPFVLTSPSQLSVTELYCTFLILDFIKLSMSSKVVCFQRQAGQAKWKLSIACCQCKCECLYVSDLFQGEPCLSVIASWPSLQNSLENGWMYKWIGWERTWHLEQFFLNISLSVPAWVSLCFGWSANHSLALLFCCFWQRKLVYPLFN